MRFVCFVFAVLVLTAPVSAAEPIDNPEFAWWSKHKKGTSVTLKMTVVFDQGSSESLLTATLIEVGDDKLVFERLTTITAKDGKEIKLPPTKREVPKTITLSEGTKKEDLPGNKPKGTYEEGTETLKVGGTEFKTKWYKSRTEVAGAKNEVKTWMADDIPGSVVKMETTTTSAKSTITTKLELIEFKKP